MPIPQRVRSHIRLVPEDLNGNYHPPLGMQLWAQMGILVIALSDAIFHCNVSGMWNISLFGLDVIRGPASGSGRSGILLALLWRVSLGLDLQANALSTLF